MRTRPPGKPKKHRNPKIPHTLGEFISEIFNALGEINNEQWVTTPPEPVIIECSIPPDMFRKLLMLCHPDKHGNSELAQEVTRWLIAERGKRKTT